MGRILAWTLLLSLTFSAGLITGQRLIRRDAMQPLVSVRTVPPTQTSDDTTEKVEKLKTTFSFYEKLAEPEEEKPVEENQPEVAEKVDAKPEKKPEAKPEPVKVVDKKPDEKPAEKPTEKPVEKPEEPSVSDVIAEKIPAELAPKKVIEDVKEIIKPKADNKALPARYTLQVSSHPTKQAASKELARLKKMGYEANLVSVEVPEKGTMFRVRIGKFHSMDEARGFQGELKSGRGIPTFVTPL